MFPFQAVEQQIKSFGQTPSQLLHDPHVPRIPLEQVITFVGSKTLFQLVSWKELFSLKISEPAVFFDRLLSKMT